uniref:26S proteasome non-ATPase regulatory subunit 8-like n=1 Tax=Callithrix jacchus TaxID=9483 RepID=UPI0023DD1FC4|nr:26S proteasome non-ATPase regulatory subunit 8-like [Callithrix jacchus]
MAATVVNGAVGFSSSGAAAPSGAVLQAAASMYKQLKGEWNRKSPNLSKCGEELGRLKLVLLELNFLPTTGTKLTKQQLILAQDILEIGAQWSILHKDMPSFECYMAQLKCYYFDYKEQLPESAYMHQLLGLNLLFLLSQNWVAEFHTELEQLPAKDIQTNVYIKHPVSLEQYLIEGSYNKVFLAKGNSPTKSYTFFLDILLDTIRDEIAGCVEKAYEKTIFTEIQDDPMQDDRGLCFAKKLKGPCCTVQLLYNKIQFKSYAYSFEFSAPEVTLKVVDRPHLTTKGWETLGYSVSLAQLETRAIQIKAIARRILKPEEKQ